MSYACGQCSSDLIEIGNGYWQCPVCQDDPMLIDDEEDGYSYDSVYGEKPEVCRTCGGVYPDCMDSCGNFN